MSYVARERWTSLSSSSPVFELRLFGARTQIWCGSESKGHRHADQLPVENEIHRLVEDDKELGRDALGGGGCEVAPESAWRVFGGEAFDGA